MPVGVWRGSLALAVAAVSLLGAAGTAAAAPDDGPAARAECGVHLLSQGLLISGVDAAQRGVLVPGPDLPIDEVIDDVVAGIVSSTGPATDAVQCVAPGPSPGSRELRAPNGCKNAGASGATLKRRLAAKAVRCLINKQRRKRGLSELRPSEDLKQAAKRHNRRMLRSGCFSHRCPGERDIVGRVVQSGYLPCGCTWTIGENLAWGVRRSSTPAAIVESWMGSPGHRAIILTREFEQVDIGVQRGKPGHRRARAATYTADFGRRD